MTLSRPRAEPRRVLLQQFARIGQALSSPARLAMIGLLAHGEKTVDQLAQATGQSLATASAHLKVLRGACLIASEKHGRQVRCRLASDSVVTLWLTLRATGEELLPEAREVLRQFAEDPTTLAQLTPAELAVEIAHDRVTLLDLRPAEEFATAHLPGARNVPFSELATLSALALDLPPGKPIYAYCRGPYCVMAAEGTRQLRALGVPATRLRFSVPEWRAALAPGETAPAFLGNPPRSA
jgi:rhodanese-related sulfurtransferase/DNA-binding transcriptional ArsR family regulator